MIKDYSELVLEASARSGVSDIVSRAEMLVSFAEKMLFKRLRLSIMEKETTLDIAKNGEKALPEDYVEMRFIRLGGNEILRKPIGQILSGKTRGYAIKGKNLITSYPEKILICLYYASLPPLAQNNTNALLEEEPELYIQALLFQIYTAQNDIEKAQITVAYLSELIENANQADIMKRHAGTRINFAKVIP